MENQQEAECLILLDGPKREIKKGIYFSSLLVNLCHKLVLQVVRQEQGRRGLSPGPTRMSGDWFSNYRIVLFGSVIIALSLKMIRQCQGEASS